MLGPIKHREQAIIILDTVTHLERQYDDVNHMILELPQSGTSLPPILVKVLLLLQVAQQSFQHPYNKQIFTPKDF